MNRQLGRLVLVGFCCLTLASAARAQPPFRLSPNDISPGDDAPRPSHRLLEGGVGDLSQAEDLLARRLHRSHNLQDFQDLLKPFQDNPELLKHLKGLRPDDLKDLQETIQNNPDLLDDPKLRDLLTQVSKLKNGEALDADKRRELENLAKDFFKQHKQDLPSVSRESAPHSGGTETPHPPVAPPHPSPSPAAAAPNWLSRDVLKGMADILKDIDHSPEGESLRNDLLHELAKKNAAPSGASSELADFLKGALSSDQVAWLAHNWTPPPMPNLGGGWSAPTPPAVPSVGADSDGLLDGVVWIAVLALLGAAAWMALVVARRQAAGAGAKGWTPGPWPVHPSQVSTRADLIRAFEHLAYLCLGRAAGPLNHLDVASRLGRSGADRAEAAGRLAHLYEQARYAPPDESLPPEELTAARGDLTALAGAAA